MHDLLWRCWAIFKPSMLYRPRDSTDLADNWQFNSGACMSHSDLQYLNQLCFLHGLPDDFERICRHFCGRDFLLQNS